MNKQKMIDSFRILSKAASDIADALSKNDVVSVNEPIKNNTDDMPMFVNIKKAKEITGFKPKKSKCRIHAYIFRV